MNSLAGRTSNCQIRIGAFSGESRAPRGDAREFAMTRNDRQSRGRCICGTMWPLFLAHTFPRQCWRIWSILNSKEASAQHSALKDDRR
jgi:hypothetical protein